MKEILNKRTEKEKSVIHGKTLKKLCDAEEENQRLHELLEHEVNRFFKEKALFDVRMWGYRLIGSNGFLTLYKKN